MEANVKQTKQLMKSFITKKKPLFVWGAPGIGKSDMFRQTAQELAKEKGKEYSEVLVNVTVDYKNNECKIEMNEEYKDPNKYFFLLDVRVTSLDPSDLRGIPFPEEGHVKWLTPNWLPNMGEGIIFFDEVNLAAPSIQAAAYQLVLDRKIGDYTLPEGWAIVAAGNRAEDKANVFPMAAPLKNRFSHVTLTPPNSEEWAEWALQNGIETDIVAFINFKPRELNNFNPNSKDPAFPTPRSWATASYMIKGETNADTARLLVGATIGDAAAQAFTDFVKLKKKVNINDILKNPKKLRDITELGMRWSIISALAELYRKDKKNMNKIVEAGFELPEEFGVSMFKMMYQINPKTWSNDLMGSKHFDTIHKRYGKYLL